MVTLLLLRYTHSLLDYDPVASVAMASPSNRVTAPRRKLLAALPHGDRYVPPPVPAAVVTKVSYSARDLLAINTDALDAVLNHAQRSHHSEAFVGAEDDVMGFAARLELQLWMDTFIAETARYRSVSVASELLLERATTACAGLRAPHMLSTAVAMALLFHLSPQFRQVAGLATAIVDEIAQALYVQPLRCASLSRAAESFGRSTYFETFYSLVQAYHAQKAKAQKYAVMQARGQRVLERAVIMCRKGHARRLLRQWHQLAHFHTHLRNKYRKLFSRASNQNIAEKAVHMWRQHAHRVHVAFLTKHNRRGVEALQDAQLEHRKLDEKLKAAQFDAQQRDKGLADCRAMVDALKARLVAARSSGSVAHSEYIARRKKWATLTQLLFNDARRIPPDRSYVTWLADICSDQAGALAEPSGGPALRRSRVTSQALLDALETLADNTGRKRPAEVGFQASLGLTRAVGWTTEVAERVSDLYRFITRGLEPPIATPDLVRGDQLAIRHFAHHLMELSLGGHAGLIQSNAVPTPTMIVFQSSLRDEPRTGTVADEHEVTAMTRDWRDGVALIRREGVYAAVLAARDQAMGDIIQFGESVDFTRKAQAVFDQLNYAGAISRRHVEAAVMHLHHEHDAAVTATWPATGLQTVSDLSTYFTSLAEALAVERCQLLDETRHELSTATELILLFDLYDDDAQLVVRSFEEDLRRLYVVVADHRYFDGEAAGRLVDHVQRNMSMPYEHAELAALYPATAALMPDGGPATMTAMLAAIATYFDPNPFVPTHVKLRVFFRSLFRA
jgi:hypothetical protein